MKDKKYKTIEILNKMQSFSENNIVIKGTEKNFDIDFSIKNVPHLLGLQYMQKEKIRAREIIDNIFSNNYSDNQILKIIKENYNQKIVENVKNRIDTFDYFMNNLEKGIIVDKTLLGGKMNVNYLIIQKKDGDYLHLGILSGDNGALLEDYEELSKKDKDLLKTYFSEYNDNYFKENSLFDPIQEILKYDVTTKKYIPFSFDTEKQKKLNIAWKNDKENFNYNQALKEKINIRIPKKHKKRKKQNER